MPNVTYMRLCDASVICRVTYFQFPIQSVFLPYRSTGKTAAYVLYRISDIGRCRKLGKYVSCTERTVQRNDFELILTVTMETRHPVENYFDSEFRAICNQCGVMAAWSRKTLKFEDDFFAFWGKKTPCGKISKILFRKFSLLHQSTFFSNFVKFVRRKIGEIVRFLLVKNWLPLKLSLLRGSRPKSARASPKQCTQSAPDFIQIGSLSTEL